MAEALKTFREGEDILASETNANNQFLLSKLSDNAAQVQQYVEGEVATIKSNVASVQATLQNNIDELAAKINVYIIDSYVKGVNGYVIWSNGYCEQWGLYNNGVKTVTFLKKFANTNYVVTLAQFGGRGASEYQGLEKVTAVRVDAMDVSSNQCTGVFWRACGYLAKGQYMGG